VRTHTGAVSTAATRQTFLAAPFLAAGAVLLAIPTAQAATIVDQVDIIDGRVDVNEDGVFRGLGFDDATDVLLFFNNYAPIRVDIIDGLIDVTEYAGVTTSDDLSNVDLNDLEGLTPTSHQVDIIDGFVDVNQDGGISTFDDATDIRLVRLVNSVVDQVDMIDGLVDVTEGGVINTADDAADILLGFNDAVLSAGIGHGAVLRVDVIDGHVDVTEDGVIASADSLQGVDLNDSVNSFPTAYRAYMYHGFVHKWGDGAPDDSTDVKLVKLAGAVVYYVQIIDGQVDVQHDGVINSADDLNNVLFLFDEAAPIRVDIIDGRVDVTESGVVSIADDLPNTAVVHIKQFGSRETWPVDIIDGKLDVWSPDGVDEDDDLTDVRLLVP
jgi:hypothetical protein